MALKKTVSLNFIFTEFFVFLIILFIIAVFVPVFLLLTGVYSGFLLPANANEITVREFAENFSASDIFPSLPENVTYVITDKYFYVKDYTMKNNYLKKAILYAKGFYNNNDYGYRFFLLTGDNEYIILKYSTLSSYSQKNLNKILPSPEILCYIMIGLNIFLFSVFITFLFAKKVKKQILPLNDAALKISSKNLDFEVGISKIKELNDVLISFQKMKTELKHSIEKEWKSDQIRREQISALAHDIKTPLTIIYGNSDLLNETELTAEQKLYIRNILESAKNTEKLINSLIEFSKSDNEFSLKLSDNKTNDFIESLKKKIVSLASIKNIKTEFSENNIPRILSFDVLLLERAIMNIVSNSVDFTDENGIILTEFFTENNFFVIRITDSGKGFSKESLKRGCDYFFTGDKSRNSSKHYGLGLSTAKDIAEHHKGKIITGNSESELKGACVSLYMPLFTY